MSFFKQTTLRLLPRIRHLVCPRVGQFGGLLAAVLLLGALSGCAQTQYVWAKDVPAQRAAPDKQTRPLGPGDVIAVSVVGQPTLSGAQTIAVNGTISIPDIGPVAVGGGTIEQATAAVKQALLRLLASPNVSVTLVSSRLEVTLLGEVRSPGKYLLQSGDGVAAAIATSGGLTEFASKNSIYLIRPGEPYRVRFKMSDLLKGGDSARKFPLRDGDLLFVE